jgi:hypothetical protein
MKIVFEKEFSRHGNDCMIYESFSILEMFDGDVYLAQQVTYYSGWFGTDYDKKSEFFDYRDQAMDKLNEWGLEYAEQHQGR